MGHCRWIYNRIKHKNLNTKVFNVSGYLNNILNAWNCKLFAYFPAQQIRKFLVPSYRRLSAIHGIYINTVIAAFPQQNAFIPVKMFDKFCSFH